METLTVPIQSLTLVRNESIESYMRPLVSGTFQENDYFESRSLYIDNHGTYYVQSITAYQTKTYKVDCGATALDYLNFDF